MWGAAVTGAYQGLAMAKKLRTEYGDAQTREMRRLRAQYGFVDHRSAAEVMAAVVTPLTRCAAEYYREGATSAMVIIGSERAGPAARQIFSAAVMREQVDPQ